MKYVIFNSRTNSEAVSKRMYFLTRPETERDANYVTDRIFQVIEHPTNGESALVFYESYVLNLHIKKYSAKLIQLYVSLNRSENNRQLQEIKKLVDENNSITAGQLISENMVVKTYTEMFDAGWFPETLN